MRVGLYCLIRQALIDSSDSRWMYPATAPLSPSEMDRVSDNVVSAAC